MIIYSYPFLLLLFLRGNGKLITNNELINNANRARLGPILPPPRPPARTCSFSSVTSSTPPPPPPAAAHQSILARFLSSPRPKPSPEQPPAIIEDLHESLGSALLHQQPLRDRPRHVNPEARLSTFSKKQTPLTAISPLPNSISTTTFLTPNHSSTINGIEPLQNVVCDSVQRPIPPVKPTRDGSIKTKIQSKTIEVIRSIVFISK